MLLVNALTWAFAFGVSPPPATPVAFSTIALASGTMQWQWMSMVRHGFALPARAGALPRELSGGEAQRFAIARALAVQPEVLLMDEPASALDPLATGRIEDLILELKKEYTIIIVTHNMQQAARISDHTAFFYLGELVEYGLTSKIFTSPSKKQTEDYVTGRFG